MRQRLSPNPVRASAIAVHSSPRDDGFVCCGEWAKTLEATGRFRVTLFDAGDMPEFKRSVGVPTGMAGCHTAVADDYVIEGHVPAEDVLRLLEQKPKDVLGLVVPGMPRGAPGMEQPDGTKDEYVVFAFKAGGVTEEFRRYAGSAAGRAAPRSRH